MIRPIAPLTLLAAALILSACVSTPGTDVRGGAPGGAQGRGPAPAFEEAQYKRAQELEKDGQLAEAAWTWEVLTVLRPDSVSYRDSLAAARQQIEAAAADKLQRGQQAQKRGDLDGATTQYLSVLALQPENSAAADALRAVETERNKRVYLGTPSRVTLRKGAQTAKQAAAKAPAGQDRNELEHIAMLSAQGELDEPIKLLEKRSVQDRGDPSARRLLADLYVRKAEKTAPTDRQSAMGWLQKCLTVDPKHARATSLMRQWIDDSMARGSGGGGGPAPVGLVKNKR